jgi:hypothetical protein
MDPIFLRCTKWQIILNDCQILLINGLLYESAIAELIPGKLRSCTFRIDCSHAPLANRKKGFSSAPRRQNLFAEMVRRFKSEVQQALMLVGRILRKACDSQGIFSVDG